MRRLLRAAFVLVPLAVANVANASDADRMFDEGKRLLEQRKNAEACAMFEASQKLETTVRTALYLGACYEVVSKWASALRQFKLAEELATTAKDPRREVAHARGAQLVPKVSTVTVSLAQDDPAVHVTIDNLEVPRAGWSSIPVDPGAHTIVASAAGKKPWSFALTAPEAPPRPATVIVPALAPDDVPRPPTPAPDLRPGPPAPPRPVDAPDGSRGLDTRRIAGIAVGGVGLVAIGIGSYLGLHAKSQFDDSSPHCRADDHCDATGGQLRTDAKSSALTSTILFGFGAALVVTGVVLYVTGGRPSQRTALSISPGIAKGRAGLDVGWAF